jgi:hypothetical protein
MARIHAAAADRAAGRTGRYPRQQLSRHERTYRGSPSEAGAGECRSRSNFRADRYIAAAPLFVKAVE